MHSMSKKRQFKSKQGGSIVEIDYDFLKKATKDIMMGKRWADLETGDFADEIQKKYHELNAEQSTEAEVTNSNTSSKLETAVETVLKTIGLSNNAASADVITDNDVELAFGTYNPSLTTQQHLDQALLSKKLSSNPASPFYADAPPFDPYKTFPDGVVRFGEPTTLSDQSALHTTSSGTTQTSLNTDLWSQYSRNSRRSNASSVLSETALNPSLPFSSTSSILTQNAPNGALNTNQSSPSRNSTSLKSSQSSFYGRTNAFGLGPFTTTSSNTTTSNSRRSSSSSLSLHDIYMDKKAMDDIINILPETELSDNLFVGDFYDPRNAGSFPYRMTNKQIDFETTKSALKTMLSDIREDHKRIVEEILSLKSDRKTTLENYLRFVTQLIKILSRVYVCVVVSQIYMTTTILPSNSADKVQALQKRVSDLKSLLADTLPFLLKLENYSFPESTQNPEP